MSVTQKKTAKAKPAATKAAAAKKAAPKPATIPKAAKTPAKPRMDALGKIIEVIKSAVGKRENRVPGYVDNATKDNLKKEAAKRGVSESMLVAGIISKHFG